MATYKKYATKNNTPIQVQSAVEDGAGKNIQNNYAKQDGYYNKLTSGYSENLTPYSSESGVTQNIPFNFQGTGCGNGATQVDTGSYGIIKNKRGFGLNVNQLCPAITNSNIESNNATFSVSDGVITFTATAENGRVGLVTGYGPKFVQGHKYIMMASVKTTTATDKIVLNNGLTTTPCVATTNWQTLFVSFTWSVASGKYPYPRINDTRTGGWDAVQVKYFRVIDLTQMYQGDDMIPADLLAHPENFFRYYQGSMAHRTGGMLFAQGRYLKTYGRNQWDEEWELGTFNWSTGSKEPSVNVIRNKNPIRVVPNSIYNVCSPNNVNILKYDIAGNYLGFIDTIKNSNFVIPPDCAYINFRIESAYGTSYNNDVTYSIYYIGESGYNEHYPYEELDNIDTGNENLLWARNSADEKLANGTILRNIGTINLGDRDWTRVEGDGYWYWASISPTGSKAFASDSIGNISCDNYLPVKMNDGGFANNTIAMDNSVIVVRTDSTSTEPSGMVYFELATPTTEQGTEYESKVDINDFGSMSLESSNGIPQGIEIFYPVDYKAFVDTLYNHTDGDATSIALTSELEASELARDSVDTQLKEALGGTLRQLLAISQNINFNNTAVVDLGDLAWSGNSENLGGFVVSSATMQALGIKGGLCKMICTKYTTYSGSFSWGAFNSIPNLIIGKNDDASSYALYCKDTNYTTGATFGSAMKGVLLAYEKA